MLYLSYQMYMKVAAYHFSCGIQQSNWLYIKLYLPKKISAYILWSGNSYLGYCLVQYFALSIKIFIQSMHLLGDIYICDHRESDMFIRVSIGFMCFLFIFTIISVIISQCHISKIKFTKKHYCTHDYHQLCEIA